MPVAIRNGAPIRVGDVAEVRIGFPAPIGDAVITTASSGDEAAKPDASDDGMGLLLIVEKQPTGNTLEVTRNVEKALEELKPGMKDVEIDPTIFRPATFIERSLENLSEAMWIGLGLVVAILVLFLFDWRTAIISLIAIPLSLISAVLILLAMGVTINTMVLAGLVIAMGEVVDDAIIDVENIVRRLRLNRAAGSPESAMTVVFKASIEVRSAVVFASLIVILVFLPIFFLEGLSGSFFRPLALTYVLAILASLLVALTVTPALSLMLLPGAADRHAESPIVRMLKKPYRAILPALTRSPIWAILILIGAFAWTGYAVMGLGQEFLPDFQENDFLMHWVEKPGTSLEAMRRLTVRAAQDLQGPRGRPQLRLAHRPRRGGRRGLRAELHRALDQRRPDVRPQGDDGADPARHRRVSGARAEGRADLLERADQGSPHRRRRDDRRADLRARAGCAPPEGGRGRRRHGQGRGRDGPQGRPEHHGPPARHRGPARGRRAARPDARRRPPRRLDAPEGHEGRRALSGAEGLRRRRLGRGEGPRRRLEGPQPPDRDSLGRTGAAGGRRRRDDRARAQ